MFIEVINKKFNLFNEEMTDDNRKIWTFIWTGLYNDGYKIISDEIYFNFDIKIKFKKTESNNKIIFGGECNEKFWFFKIIKKVNPPLNFSIKKPIYDFINEFKIVIIDWYNVIKSIQVNDITVEYAVGKEL
jgi:hypothetical protein